MELDIFGLPSEPEKHIEVDGEVIPERSAAYNAAVLLTEKEKQLAALTEANNEKLERQKFLNNEISRVRKEMQDQINKLAEEEMQIREELYDVRRDIRNLKWEIENARRLLRQALENEQKQEQYLKNKILFDKRMSQYAYSDRILEHQKDGAFILATNMRTILGDKRGAGKTLTAIAAWDMNQSQRVLVLVPDDVVRNFVHEIHFWAPHRNVFPVGKMSKVEREFALNVARNLDQFVIVVNYSAWRKDKSLIQSLIDLRFDTVVLDEAHLLKNTNTAAYRGVREIVLGENCCPKCGGAVERRPIDRWTSADYCVNGDWASNDGSTWEFLDRSSIKMVIPMTGTVILNKPQDLFALLSLIDPIQFDSEINYLRMYCEQDWFTGKWKFKSGGLDSLTKKLSGKYIAREGVKTPGQVIEVRELDMDPELYPLQHRIITQLSKHAQIILDSGKKMNIMYTIALITRKRQANVWPAGISLKNEDGDVVFTVGDEVRESIKLDECIKWDPKEKEYSGLIPEYTENGDMELGARVVVFSQFKGPLAELEKRLTEAGIKVARYDGDTPQHKRDEIEIDFDRKFCDEPGYVKKYQVLLANYKTGGTGLNFTGATETIILDEEWNPGKADQAFGRTDRLGQIEETRVTILRLKNSIDDWMVELNKQKQEMIEGFEQSTVDLANELLNAMKGGTVQ